MNPQEVYLASLLHDLGKFYQRADTSSDLGISKRLLPSNDQEGGYKHVLWTNKFITEQENIFNPLFSDPEQRRRVTHLVLHHHHPQTFEEALFALGDRMASGWDRTQKDKSQTGLSESDYERIKTTPLAPIFNSLIVHGQGGVQPTHDWHYPLKALSLNKTDVFPGQETHGDYQTLWEHFIREFALLPTHNLSVFNESFLALLKKYNWCIPASIIDFPEISLYDHAKMVSAFAGCLFAYHEVNPFRYQENKIEIPNDVYPFLFLNVELTGIQSFLYNVNSNKAARALKGRSFFLNLLIDTIKERILHDLQLSSAHIVYASGGKCYFLLPNTIDVRKKLQLLEEEVIRQLHDDRTIGDELYVCFGKQAFGMSYVEPASYLFRYNLEGIAQDEYTVTDYWDYVLWLKDKKRSKNEKFRKKILTLGDLWKAVGQSAAEKKSQKYQGLFQEKFDSFFTPQGGASDEVCALTGLFFEQDQKDLNALSPYGDDEDSEPVYVKRSVYEQVKIGKNLQQAEYLINFIGKLNPQQAARLKDTPDYIQPLQLDVHTFIYSEGNTGRITLLKDLQDARKHLYRIQTLNKYVEEAPTKLIELRGIIEPKWYGGNKQAQSFDKEQKARLKDFDALADSKGSSDYSRLGVLRMDVDGLGQIFIKGFSPERSSFSAYATLSSLLDWFFSGYLNSLRERYANHVNILYSGGDDIFAIGKWDQILLFAEDIRHEFRQFVVNREELSISAGVALVGVKFPILKAADLAREYEEEIAKSFDTPGAYGSSAGFTEADFKKLNFKTDEKNAICLFGIAVCWDKEWSWVKEIKARLVNWLAEGQLTKAVLHKIQLFYDQSRTPDAITWRWHAAYYIGRQRNNRNQEAMEFLEKLWLNDQYNHFNLGNRTLTLLTVAARWAELELRSRKSSSLD